MTAPCETDQHSLRKYREVLQAMPPPSAATHERLSLLVALLSLLVLLTLSALLARDALAYHDASHSYTLRGYVLDASGSPMRGTRVTVSRNGIVVAGTNTDIWGWYSLTAPLGAADFSSRLELRAGGQGTVFRMTAVGDGRRSVPIHHLNLVGGEAVEQRMLRFRIPFWIYPLAGVIGLIVAAFMLEKYRRRRRRRLKRATAAAAPEARKSSPVGRKQGRRRR